jgi:hypothetical protein
MVYAVNPRLEGSPGSTLPPLKVCLRKRKFKIENSKSLEEAGKTLRAKKPTPQTKRVGLKCMRRHRMLIWQEGEYVLWLCGVSGRRRDKVAEVRSF